MTIREIKDVTDICECEDDGDVVDVVYQNLLGQTEMAALVKVDDENHWIPKNQIYDVVSKTKTMTIKRWIATQKGIY